ncbi:unnamed protein product [Urochloa humidicola]
MAAIRSALAMLGRRSLGGRGPEIHHVFRPAVSMMPPPLPSLRPASHSLKSHRHLLTGGGCQQTKLRIGGNGSALNMLI